VGKGGKAKLIPDLFLPGWGSGLFVFWFGLSHPSAGAVLGALSEPFSKGGNPFAVRGSCRESAPAVGL